MQSSENPFKLSLGDKISSTFLRSLVNKIEPKIENITALNSLAEAYEECLQKGLSSDNFTKQALEKLSISYDISEKDLNKLPLHGPGIIVANHPFGGIEGIILIDILKSRRNDFKILANFILSRLKLIAHHFIFVDPFGAKSSTKKNTLPLRDAIEHLNNGGILATFPSGTVSHFQWRSRQVTDPSWNINIARIARRAKVPVIPLFFEGNNGLLFQVAGILHPLLRTALLPRELVNKMNTKLKVRIGNPIPYERLAEFESDEDALAYLRLRTYILGSEHLHEKLLEKKRIKSSNRESTRILEPIVPAVDPLLMKKEVSLLPPEQILVENNEFIVAYGQANQIPFTLREIGRLREVTFRKISEGTGKSIDLDGFDNYYAHLFVWHKGKSEVVGAYRLALVKNVVRQYGINGLYTSTLFAYKQNLLDQLGDAIELGRSFVREEYQRSFSSLDLLWKGVGGFVNRHVNCKILFGTVSISNEYNAVSRMLITSFLKGNSYLPEFARLIKARNPFKSVPLSGIDSSTTSVVVKDLEKVNELLSEIEATHHTIPILLKQYLRLGGKFLGFNIDQNFGDVLDGLIYVDLSETDPRMLSRYLGKEEHKIFLNHHGKN